MKHNRFLIAPVCLASALLVGCTARYSADVVNDTPQPVYAQIIGYTDRGATMMASERFGPGDRGLVGPVLSRQDKGEPYLLVDTVPNPQTPAQEVLLEGPNYLVITQEGGGVAGPLRILRKKPATAQ